VGNFTEDRVTEIKLEVAKINKDIKSLDKNSPFRTNFLSSKLRTLYSLNSEIKRILEEIDKQERHIRVVK
jgi:peptidoglycan hydrolase CwlO-like protein